MARLKPIWSLVVIIAVLLVILIYVLTADQDKVGRNDNILQLTNKAEIDRLNELVMRHNDGKGDYLMLIPPIFDGGYTIHDVQSNGKVIRWFVDNTRSGDEHAKQMFLCKGISMQETAEKYSYFLEQCDNWGEERIPILTIDKN